MECMHVIIAIGCLLPGGRERRLHQHHSYTDRCSISKIYNWNISRYSQIYQCTHVGGQYFVLLPQITNPKTGSTNGQFLKLKPIKREPVVVVLFFFLSLSLLHFSLLANCAFDLTTQSEHIKMPKNKGKGGKNFKKGKKQNEGETRRELIFKEDGQEYAQVQKMLGDGRAALSSYDGVARTGLIRGTMRRRVWINTVITTAIWRKLVWSSPPPQKTHRATSFWSVFENFSQTRQTSFTSTAQMKPEVCRSDLKKQIEKMIIRRLMNLCTMTGLWRASPQCENQPNCHWYGYGGWRSPRRPRLRFRGGNDLAAFSFLFSSPHHWNFTF